MMHPCRNFNLSNYLPGCYPTDLGNMDEWRGSLRGGLVMEDDVMKLGITLFVCCTVQTDKPSGQTLIQELSAITVCTLDSCLTVNTTKPAGLSRKWQWHMGLLSVSQLSCFWQRCPLPLFHRDKKLLDDKGSWSLWKHIMQSIICGCGSAFFANKVER